MQEDPYSNSSQPEFVEVFSNVSKDHYKSALYFLMQKSTSMDEFESQKVELVANFGSLYKGVKKHWSVAYHYRRMVFASTYPDV